MRRSRTHAATVYSRHVEDPRFGTGRPFSLGIAEELLLVDPATGSSGADWATGTPIWVEADVDVDRACALVTEHDGRRLPVIEDHRLVGIIPQADIARHAAGQAGDLVAAISADPPNT